MDSQYPREAQRSSSSKQRMSHSVAAPLHHAMAQHMPLTTPHVQLLTDIMHGPQLQAHQVSHPIIAARSASCQHTRGAQGACLHRAVGSATIAAVHKAVHHLLRQERQGVWGMGWGEVGVLTHSVQA